MMFVNPLVPTFAGKHEPSHTHCEIKILFLESTAYSVCHAAFDRILRISDNEVMDANEDIYQFSIRLNPCSRSRVEV